MGKVMVSPKSTFVRKADAMEILGLNDWTFRKWVETGVVQSYGISRVSGRPQITSWVEMTPDERGKQRRLFRRDELVGLAMVGSEVE